MVAAGVLGFNVLTGVLEAALAAFLLSRRRRFPATWFLSGALLLVSLRTLAFALPELTDNPLPRGVVVALPFSAKLFDSCVLALAIVFPHWRFTRARAAWIGAAFVPVAVLAVLLAATPASVVQPDGSPTTFNNYVGVIMSVGAYLAATAIFGVQWLRTAAGAARSRFLYVLVPFLVWNLNDGATIVAHAIDPSRALLAQALPAPFIGLALLQLLTALLLGALALARALRTPRARAREDRALAAWVAVGAVASLVQFLGADRVGFRALHLAVDAVPMFALAYGVARYHVLDIDVKVRWTVRQTAVAAALVLAFFAASALVRLFVGGPAPLWAGLATVGVLLVAARPLQRRVGGAAVALLDRLRPEADYVFARKVEVYSSNMEEAFAAGALSDQEHRFLEELRHALGITPEEHRVIEHVVRSRRGQPAGALAAGGILLGKYAVVRPLRSGGMGRAVLAQDRTLDRMVVIKELPPEARGTRERATELLREARLAARVHHPNVVTVYEVERSGDDAYIVMEYCEGGSFQDVLDKRGRLDRDEVVRLGVEVLEGLSATHAQGIVHRDLKPSNILLDADGRYKVADFGVAHATRGETLGRRTLAGTQPGTVAYMSPEQVQGRTVDARSDLYSVAVVLYRAATGRSYLDLDDLSDFEARRRVVEADPRLPVADLPEGLNGLLAQALAKRPEERFPTARDMQRALAHPPARALPRRTRSRSAPASVRA